jgi:hypothetical protein
MHVSSDCCIVHIYEKIGLNACVWWGDAPEFMFLLEGPYTIAYIFLCHFVYIFVPTSRDIKRSATTFRFDQYFKYFTLKTESFHART